MTVCAVTAMVTAVHAAATQKGAPVVAIAVAGGVPLSMAVNEAQ